MKNELKLPFILSDRLILQRDKRVSLWGWYLAKSEIKIFLNQEVYSTISDDTGYFEIKLSRHKAGGPYNLIFIAGDDKVEIKDVLFGDVWVLSGQSNMQLWMSRIKKRYPKEIEMADNEKIRFFTVPQRFCFRKPIDDLNGGQWNYAVGEPLKILSGIGYFFAKEYYKNCKVPIGLISTAVGGTHVDSWMSSDLLNKLGTLPENFERLMDDDYINMIQRHDANYNGWYQGELTRRDIGLKNYWYREIDDSNWDSTDLKHLFDLKYREPGVSWLRKKIRIPQNLVGSRAWLEFGTFTDADEIYVNGRKVGSTGYKYPPRDYEIGNLPDTINIAIRLIIHSNFGGSTISKHHLIMTKKGSIDVDLLGKWKIKRGCSMPVKMEQTFFQYEPSGLFNGMIFPLRKVKVSGILWYQGESDTGKPYNYSKLFINLIQEWRKLFNDNELPFLYCQLPNCGIEPQHSWSELRNEQRKSLVLRKTAMVVTLGLGENDDLHPLNKLSIAKYLCTASNELSKFPNGYSNGPLPLYVKQINNEIWIKFMTFGKGLKADLGGCFNLIDNGINRSLENYIVNGNHIIISSMGIFSLTRNAVIRYGWGNTPNVFIYNEENIPASPFEFKIHTLADDS